MMDSAISFLGLNWFRNPKGSHTHTGGGSGSRGRLLNVSARRDFAVLDTIKVGNHVQKMPRLIIRKTLVKPDKPWSAKGEREKARRLARMSKTSDVVESS